MLTNAARVVTGKVRLSYVHLFETWAANEGQDPRYSVMILIPKTDTETLDRLKAAEKYAEEQGVSTRWNGRMPKGLKSIIHDGDEDADDYPERRGHWYMTVGSQARFKPGVVDANLQPILDPSEVYSGCYARVSMTAYPYAVSGNNGVSFGLRNVQKLADGEPLGGTSRPEDDFGQDLKDLL